MYSAWRLWKQAAGPVLPFSDPHHFTVQQISPTGGAIGGSKRIWSLTVLRSHFVHGVLINLTNPKSVMFAAVVFAAVVLIVLFPPNLGLVEKALIVGNHLALAWVFYFCLTWLVSRPAVTRRYFKAKQLFDRCAAGVMAALGLRLLLSPR